MPWLKAASFAVSGIGHLLNRTGGRGKVSASQTNTSFIDNEVGQIRDRQNQMSDKFLQTANAGTGFAQMTSGRASGAMGTPQQSSMLANAQIGGFEQAANATIQNEAAGQGGINQLLGMKTQAEMDNTASRNNATASNTMMARNDMNNLFGSISGGMLGFAGQRRDDDRFTAAMGFQNKHFSTIQRFMQRKMTAGTNQQGLSMPKVPYGSVFNGDN